MRIVDTALITLIVCAVQGTMANFNSKWVFMEEANLNYKPHLRQGARAASDINHKVVFARKQKNMELLKAIAEDVSDPRSSSYGNHMTKQEIADMCAFPEAEKAIEEFLLERNIQITHTTRYGDYFTAEARVSQWEEIFQTEFFEFHDLSKQPQGVHWEQPTKLKDSTPRAAPAEEGSSSSPNEMPARTILRARHYSLPESLVPYVSAVFNTVQLPVLTNSRRPNVQRIGKSHPHYDELISQLNRDERGVALPTSLRNPHLLSKLRISDGDSASDVPSADEVAPQSASQLRGASVGAVSGAGDIGGGVSALDDVIIDGYVSPALVDEVYKIYDNTGSLNTTQAIYASLEQTVSPSDLTDFQNYFDLPEESIAYYYGGYVEDNACKPNADDCLEANLDIQYIMSIAQNVPTTWYYWGGADPWLDWITAVADMEDPPKVWSLSYSSYELAYSSSYLNSFDDEAVKLSNMGVTIMAASGDDGVAGFLVADGDLDCDYYAQFPASSPYVTAVGGTMGPETDDPEVVCQSDKGSAITTGGGFSSHYDQPSFQEELVQAYFDQVDGTSKQPAPGVLGYDPTKRGLPDVALMANAYLVMAGAELLVVSGTSASSPVFAGMVSLVNSARVDSGNSTLGWLNPLLYAYYESFVNDITSGDNKCMSSGAGCCEQGFYAADGWDPATGLGSINFQEFLLTLANVTSVPAASSNGGGGSNDDDNSSGLSDGAIAGIVIGALVGVGLLLWGIVYAIHSYFAKSAAAGGGSLIANPHL